MLDPRHEDYVRFLKRIAALNSAYIVPKAAMYGYFTDALGADTDSARRDAPLLCYLVESLEVDLLMGLAKLTERNADRSIYKLLNTAESHRARIKWREPMSAETLMKHKAALTAHRATLDAIKAQRDQYYAHGDARYFFNPEARHDDHPVTYQDIVALIRTLQQIIGDHMYHLEGSMHVSMDAFFRTASAQMLDALIHASRQRRSTGT